MIMNGETLNYVITGLCAVFGFSEDELKDSPNVNLHEMDIFESLSMLTLVTYLEKKCGKKINISEFSFDDFSTPSKLANAIERL